jgi:hypothetical protein
MDLLPPPPLRLLLGKRRENTQETERGVEKKPAASQFPKRWLGSEREICETRRC